jgi:acyl transferase domain-containing protein
MSAKLSLAGIPMSDLAGSQTSVYVGCFTKDFESVQGRDPCKKFTVSLSAMRLTSFH